MLYVVQIVMGGVAEKPQLFLEEAWAEAAYVECASRLWTQRYAVYCEHHGISADSFASAQAFVNTIEIAEKSTVNFWTLEESPLVPERTCGTGAEEFMQVAEGIAAVQKGLTQLLTEVSNLAERCDRLNAAKAEAQPVRAPVKAAMTRVASHERWEAVTESSATPEWRDFVALIMRSCSSSRNEFQLLPRDEWRQDIYSDRTSLEYWEWVAVRIMRFKEEAQNTGYTIAEQPDDHGFYRFADKEGIQSEDRYDSEWEAWCAAGLHLEGTSCVRPEIQE